MYLLPILTNYNIINNLYSNTPIPIACNSSDRVNLTLLISSLSYTLLFQV